MIDDNNNLRSLEMCTNDYEGITDVIQIYQ